MEPPECPICLQPYDNTYTIPRVLTCGHSACEHCLTILPRKYPLTIRCPACTQLVKFPSPLGPTSLPKNIDLLHLVVGPTSDGSKPNRRSSPNEEEKWVVDSSPPRLWSEEFYATWTKWVLLENAVLKVEGKWVLREKDLDRKVGVFKVGEVKGTVLTKLSYLAGILNFLHCLNEDKRDELCVVLRIGSKRSRLNGVLGLWGDSGDGSLYLVSERLEGVCGFEVGLGGEEGLSSFVVMGMEICEALMELYSERFVLGCVGVSCFELDGFGRVSFSLSEVLEMGRGVREGVKEVGLGGKSVGGRELCELVRVFLRKEVFLSPEVLVGLLRKENAIDEGGLECGSFKRSVDHGSDVWSLGCILLRLLVGKKFVEEMVGCVDCVISNTGEKNWLDFASLYIGFKKKVSSLLESELGKELESLQKILCNCLDLDHNSRPTLTGVWKCVRGLMFKLQLDTLKLDDGRFSGDDKKYCIVLGELCHSHIGESEGRKGDVMQGAECSVGESLDQAEDGDADKHLVKGLVQGKVKSKDMKGHLDCITGLAIGGGFLFSSSYDKLVHVWSLQDFSHIHVFKGHEHKVMSTIYVDEEEPLCITGDSGGGIFFWSIQFPLGQEPMKKWYENKDWRYSGIHALTTAGNGYLYTGSGDRLIKAWSLQDGTQICTMEGHKSVVSTLMVCNGILYSGSWDGTIRLWSLDHSLLTVLGEDVPGAVTSVLSLKAIGNMIISAHENGAVKVWRNDMLETSTKLHVGSIFAVDAEEKWLFTGGWDKTINVLEICGDELQVETRPIGSITGGSVITAILCWQGKLFVGYGDRTLKEPCHSSAEKSCLDDEEPESFRYQD